MTSPELQFQIGDAEDTPMLQVPERSTRYLTIAAFAALAAAFLFWSDAPRPTQAQAFHVEDALSDGVSYVARGKFSVQICHDTKGFSSPFPTVIRRVSEITLLENWFILKIEDRPDATVILPRENVIFVQIDG